MKGVAPGSNVVFFPFPGLYNGFVGFLSSRIALPQSGDIKLGAGVFSNKGKQTSKIV